MADLNYSCNFTQVVFNVIITFKMVVGIFVCIFPKSCFTLILLDQFLFCFVFVVISELSQIDVKDNPFGECQHVADEILH